MGRLKCVEDYLIRGLGYTKSHVLDVLHYRADELAQSITFPWLKDRMEDLRLSLVARLFLEDNPPHIEAEIFFDREVKSFPAPAIIPEDVPTDKDYGLSHSDKEKATLFWFQKKHAANILKRITVDKLKAAMLVAQAGSGKTFILGAILRRLIDQGFHVGKTISPWPYCYITKASVVEQTKRVLENSFGIDTVYECFVTNYDQMRSKFGEIFVQEKTIVTNGQEELSFIWRPKIHPCVFVLDECQAAKNEQSTQSKIVCSIANINDSNVHVIFSSATPFTKVSEAKYFVLNARTDQHLY